MELAIGRACSLKSLECKCYWDSNKITKNLFYGIYFICLDVLPWLSWLERSSHNRKVVSSILTGSTIFLDFITSTIFLSFITTLSIYKNLNYP